MPKPIQQQFWGFHGSINGRCDKCLVGDFVDADDNACSELMSNGYETVSCDSEKGLRYLQAVRGPTLLNISARPFDIPPLPQFIPHGFSRSSGKYLHQTNIPWIAVSLGKIVNRKTLEVVNDVRAHVGADDTAKIMLLNYADDPLIERIWDARKKVLPALAQTNVDLMTSIDYSVFLDQPHLESVVNIKRGFVTYDLLAEYGATVIPHVYWRGNTSIRRIAEWLNTNPNATHIASYQGLRKTRIEWEEFLIGLGYLKSLLQKNVTLLISGPSIPSRIATLLTIWPNTIITNGVATQAAIHHSLKTESGSQPVSYQPLVENIEYYNHLVKQELVTPQRIYKISSLDITPQIVNRWHIHGTSSTPIISNFY